MKRILTLCLVLGLCSSVWAQKLTTFLDETERRAVAETFQRALENNKDGAESSWANPERHHSGAVTPTRSYINEDNLSCREYISTIMIEGASTRTVGSACRSGGRGWVVMGERTEVSTSNPQHVYVYRNPYRYGFTFGAGALFYPYFYDGWWYGGPYYHHHHHHHHHSPPPGPAPQFAPHGGFHRGGPSGGHFHGGHHGHGPRR